MGDVHQEGREVRATPYTNTGNMQGDIAKIGYLFHSVLLYVVKPQYCDRSIVLIFRLIDSVDAVVPVAALWLL